MARQGALRRRFGPAAVAAAMVGAVVVGTVVTGTATPASAADSPGGGNGDSGATGNGGSGHGGHAATRAAMADLPRPHALGCSTLFGGSSTPLETTELNPSWGGAAGEMISTTADLTRFYSALMRGRLLPRAELDEMMPATGGPGLGIGSVRLGCGVTVWGHEGTIHGSSTVALTTRDGRHAAAFNTNADWVDGQRPLAEAEFCR